MQNLSNTSTVKPVTAAKDDMPWWRYKMLWLVIGGPLVVVVAGIVTAVIAIRGADPVMTKEEMDSSAKGQPALTPAVQARNHAAAPPKP